MLGSMKQIGQQNAYAAKLRKRDAVKEGQDGTGRENPRALAPTGQRHGPQGVGTFYSGFISDI